MSLLRCVARKLERFLADHRGSAAPLLALAALPVLGAVGAAIDYSHASLVRSSLQASLDSAIVAGAEDGSATWQQTALNMFGANVAAHGGSVGAPSFSVDAKGDYAATLQAAVPTHIMGLFGFTSIPLTVTAIAAGAGGPHDSCILTLDGGSDQSNVSLYFGGAPNIQMAGCSVRSDSSANCNGHAGGATVSIAAGTVDGCSNPMPNASLVPDRFTRLAANITSLCGNTRVGATWTPGSPPQPPKMQTVNRGGYIEYHVCGDLTLSGTGALNNSGTDSIIVVENGSLNLVAGANIAATQTTIVLTGSNAFGSSVNFPNGNGQSATLTLSPPTSDGDPWKGISLYQDPALTTKVDDKWGPGATFNADGVVYLPNSNITMSGVAASSNYACSKFVTHSFSTNGSAALNFQQTTDGCHSIGMQKWSDIPVHLVD